jgi:hypothetical protein
MYILSAEEQFLSTVHSSAVTLSCDTLVLTTLSSSSSATSVPFSSFPEKEQVELF